MESPITQTVEEFTCAEGVTKFLRGKKCTPETAVHTARKLVAGEYALFLPNSTMFVFDLICDRASDLHARIFTKWRLSPDVWSLWQEIWQELEKDEWTREMRAKSFRKAKFVEVISDVLNSVMIQLKADESLSAENGQLLTAMFGCLDVFLKTGHINVDELHTMGLLKNYSLLLLNDSIIEKFPINTWTRLVYRVYELPHQSSVYKPNKKSMAMYFSEILPAHLTLFGNKDSVLPEESRETLHSIFTAIAFDHERSHLPNQIANAFKNPPDYLGDAAVLYLFHEVILNLASSDMAACESIYSKLTADKFASMSEQLVNVLCKVNKTLSPDFFAKLYAKETRKKIVEWTLVSHILKLDTQVAKAHWQAVVSESRDCPLSELVVVADDISSGFVKARDFPFFVSEVYAFASRVSNNWASPEVLAKIAPKVNEMSARQIAKLGQDFLDRELLKPISLLVQGLAYCPISKQKACESFFVDYSFCRPGWAELAYHVLCVYGESILQTQPDVVKRTANGKEYVPTMELNLLFRVAELTGNTHIIDSDHVITTIAAMEKSRVIPFARRWIVLMGRIPGAYSAWFKRAFSAVPPPEILHYFISNKDLLCELPSFLEDLSGHFQKAPPPCTYDILTAYPAFLFRKFFSFFLIPMCSVALNHPGNAKVRRTLKHVFSAPTLTSAMEKDFNILRIFVATATDATIEDTISIATYIWNAHMQLIKSPRSKEYVVGASATLLENFEKTPEKEDLLISQVILSKKSAQKLDSFEPLLEKYVATVCANMTLDNLEESLGALGELPLLTPPAKSVIVASIQNFGKTAVSTSCRAQLFRLVAKTSEPENAYYVVALFLALRHAETPNSAETSTRESLLAGLREYVQILPSEDIFDLFAFCIKDLRYGPIEYGPALVDVCCILTSFFAKIHEETSQLLLVAFISAFCDRYVELDHPEVTSSFITTIYELLAEHPWAFKQYAIDLLWNTAHMLTFDLSGRTDAAEVYTSVLGLVSHMILYHRSKFFSRYHLVMKVFTALMEPLSNVGALKGSSACASAYTRVLTTLCEPPSHASSREHDDLTSRAAKSKKILRRQAHVLLVNYIHIRLNKRFAEEVNDKLMPGIYSLFALLKASELQLVNSCLDHSGRAYYHTLHSTYQDHGKWKQ